MKVFDHEVTEMQFASAIERMQRSEFKAADIVAALEDAGLPRHIKPGGYTLYLSNRVADRIIQQQRKLGKISLLGGRWRWLVK